MGGNSNNIKLVSVSKRPVIGNFCGPYPTERPITRSVSYRTDLELYIVVHRKVIGSRQNCALFTANELTYKTSYVDAPVCVIQRKKLLFG